MQYVSAHYLIEYNPDYEDNIFEIPSWKMFLSLFFFFNTFLNKLVSTDVPANALVLSELCALSQLATYFSVKNGQVQEVRIF